MSKINKLLPRLPFCLVVDQCGSALKQVGRAMHRDKRTIYISLFIVSMFCIQPDYVQDQHDQSHITVWQVDSADNPVKDAADSALLFSYFLKQNAGMCLALSKDGVNWTALNDTLPVLRPEVGQQKLMRDPSIHTGPDGLYRAVWTTDWKGNSLGYASSWDLEHWSPQRLIPVMKDRKGTVMVWAPEIFYDKMKGLYMLYWSSAVDATWSIYYCTTKDFESFTKPEVLFSNGHKGGGKAGQSGVIDAYIYQDKSRYILFYKKDDNSRVPNLYYRIGATALGPWGREWGPVRPSTGEEGPSCIYINGAYCVYTDPFDSPNANMFSSKDLVHWKRNRTNLKMSHGTVLKIPRREADRLQKNYASKLRK